MTAALELYLRALDRVSAVVDAVPTDRWDAPTPCPDWSARQLLGHLIDGQRQVLAMVTGDGPRPPVTDPRALGTLTGADPTAAWQRARQDSATALADITPAAKVATPLGTQTVEQVLGIALVEPVVHTWDLATATAQTATLDAEAVQALLPGVLALGGRLQATGMYRPPVTVPEDASAHDRLLAALGRDPHTESLRAAERRLQAAQLASDVDALTELLDDAVLFTGPDGNLYSKEDDLRAHRSGHQVLSRVEESELRLLVTGSTGVTWFLGTLEGRVSGEPFVARMRYTRTWARDAESGWRIVAAHAMFVDAD